VRGHLRRAAGAREPHRGRIVLAHDRRIEIRKSIDLSGAEEAKLKEAYVS
jgi:hypothetical protein